MTSSIIAQAQAQGSPGLFNQQFNSTFAIGVNADNGTAPFTIRAAAD